MKKISLMKLSFEPWKAHLQLEEQTVPRTAEERVFLERLDQLE